MKVLMITPGWPTKSNPTSSPFIVRQYNSLLKHGISVDIFNFEGNRNQINYLLAWIKLERIMKKHLKAKYVVDFFIFKTK